LAARRDKPAFHDNDTDTLARIFADTSDTRDFLKLFPWQAERGSRPTRRHPRDDPREDVGVVECGLWAGHYEVGIFGQTFSTPRVPACRRIPTVTPFEHLESTIFTD